MLTYQKVYKCLVLICTPKVGRIETKKCLDLDKRKPGIDSFEIFYQM